MLASLSIRNFVLIEDAVLEFGPGLTVLTGETGAGKTLLTQALELLLGERAAEGLVGAAGEEALIQGVFELTPRELARVPLEVAELAGLSVDSASPTELIASRRLHRTGRNRAFLNGAAVTLASLQQALSGLLAFSGQHEHRRLLEPGYQRQVLDAFVGEEAAAVFTAYGQAYREVREAEALLAAARDSAGQRAQERELLGFQVGELEDAALSLEEEAELLREQRRLSRAEELATVAAQAAALIRGEGGGGDILGLLGLVRGRLGSLCGVDEELDQAAGLVVDASELLTDAARQLSSYADRVEVDPARLSAVEERLGLYNDLSRKYGGSTRAAVAFLESGSERLRELQAYEEDLSSLEARRGEAAGRALELATRLSELRRQAAPQLQLAIETELAGLGMGETCILVEVRSREGELGPAGADEVEFLFAPNPGLPARPLARTASGGELSRALLSIKAALAGLEGGETLVFDEIDAGIGGRTATAVGRKLWELSRENQLLVVTHLPQVAAFSRHHFLIQKDTSPAGTVTRLLALDQEASLEELCRMMGGEPGDHVALEHARGLRDRAAAGLLD